MRKHSLLAPIVFLFVCLFSLAHTTGTAEAKSVVSNSGPIPELGYYWNNSISGWQSLSTAVTCPGGDCGWWTGLKNATASITHKARIINVSTSAEITDGAMIPVGTQLRFEQIPAANTEIAWNGTGESADSPYGYWINNADPTTVGCLRENMTREGDLLMENVYVHAFSMLNVHPATGVLGGATATLSCVGNTCTVIAAGPVSLTMNFPSTFGRFYYRYAESYNSVTFRVTDVCAGNNIPMRDVSSLPAFFGIHWCSGAGCFGGPPYSVNFPAQAITFNLTAVGGNTAPTPPSIAGPIAGNTSTPYAFSAQASDPDNDTLRYGIDWDMNGSVDEWAPALGYVASNTTQATTHTWPTAGPKTFRILAQDSKGANSAFASHTITLSTVTNGLCGAAKGIATSTPPTLGLCASGTSTPVTGTGPYAWTCLGSGGGTDDLSCTAPYVAPPTLKICETSCNGGLDRTGQTFTMNQNATKYFTACYNTALACTDASGDVTASAAWTDANAPQNIIAFPAKGELQAGTPTGTMSENFSVSYISEIKSATAQVTCVPLTCLSAKSVTDTYCPEESQNTGVLNGCGSTLTCPGTRFCDTNYREVTP